LVHAAPKATEAAEAATATPRRSRNADGYEPTCEASIAGFAKSWRRE
jgi:hypothetical protein